MKNFAGLMLTAGLIVLLCVVLAGCGAGGLSGGGDSHKIDFGNTGRFEGVVKINASFQHPMAGVLINAGHEQYVTASVNEIARPAAGWQDESFSGTLPDSRFSPVYIFIFDDINGDGKYSKNEKLGEYPGSMKFDLSHGGWQLWHKGTPAGAPDELVANDVTQLKGRNIYINCEP